MREGHIAAIILCVCLLLWFFVSHLQSNECSLRSCVRGMPRFLDGECLCVEQPNRRQQ